MVRCPASFLVSPRRAETRDDFPAPTWPTTATSWPDWTLRSMLKIQSSSKMYNYDWHKESYPEEFKNTKRITKKSLPLAHPLSKVGDGECMQLSHTQDTQQYQYKCTSGYATNLESTTLSGESQAKVPPRIQIAPSLSGHGSQLIQEWQWKVHLSVVLLFPFCVYVLSYISLCACIHVCTKWVQGITSV